MSADFMPMTGTVYADSANATGQILSRTPNVRGPRKLIKEELQLIEERGKLLSSVAAIRCRIQTPLHSVQVGKFQPYCGLLLLSA